MNYAILAESAARDIARTNPEVSISEATSTIAAALRRFLKTKSAQSVKSVDAL